MLTGGAPHSQQTLCVWDEGSGQPPAPGFSPLHLGVSGDPGDQGPRPFLAALPEAGLVYGYPQSLAVPSTSCPRLLWLPTHHVPFLPPPPHPHPILLSYRKLRGQRKMPVHDLQTLAAPAACCSTDSVMSSFRGNWGWAQCRRAASGHTRLCTM